jgi:hypothetical protein
VSFEGIKSAKGDFIYRHGRRGGAGGSVKIELFPAYLFLSSLHFLITAALRALREMLLLIPAFFDIEKNYARGCAAKCIKGLSASADAFHFLASVGC